MVGDYIRFQSNYIESAFYHEAAHTTAAAMQGMPLRERGIHVDLKGSGISHYWHRIPGDLENTEQDKTERNLTIIAIYAGAIAQKRYFPDCLESDWDDDRREVALLLEEMYRAAPDSRKAAEQELRTLATTLVEQYWSVIEGLAKALQAKPTSQQSAAEIEQNWSRGQTTMEKTMSGPELLEFFKQFGIASQVRADSEKTYNPVFLSS